eukprot:TRINITY_DN1367_c0_g1_i1.p1 TRINITY_DN1367_c0_g1~~TRINITY_DN1367_c0_g1_i1.p1  ORF type:complete len:517 (-),score=22.63 TRINITY_DN1367_c0_g1_i1:1311-2765(-)
MQQVHEDYVCTKMQQAKHKPLYCTTAIIGFITRKAIQFLQFLPYILQNNTDQNSILSNPFTKFSDDAIEKLAIAKKCKEQIVELRALISPIQCKPKLIMVEEAKTKSVVAMDICMLTDIESLHFEIIRNYVYQKKDTRISTQQMSLLDNRGLEEGTAFLLESVHLKELVKDSFLSIKAQFDSLTKIMKPQILAHFLVEQLARIGVDVIAYSFYEKEVNSVIESTVLPLFKKVKLIPADSLPSVLSGYEHYIILAKGNVARVPVPSDQPIGCNIAKTHIYSEQVHLCVRQKRLFYAQGRQWQFAGRELAEDGKTCKNLTGRIWYTLWSIQQIGIKDCAWPKEVFKVDLERVCTKSEENLWGSVIKFPEGREFVGKVVTGFGRGSKDLNIPTGKYGATYSIANIDVFEEYKATSEELMPGVYSGIAEFVEKAPGTTDVKKRYLGVLSVGWNPHFDNRNKTIVITYYSSYRKYTLIASLKRISTVIQ